MAHAHFRFQFKFTMTYYFMLLAITSAMRDHDIANLEADIMAAQNAGMDGKLVIDLEKAKEYLAQLKRLEELRQPVLAVHHITVAEIRSYDKPPPVVHQVMVATLMLLGDKENRMKVYIYVVEILIFLKVQRECMN